MINLENFELNLLKIDLKKSITKALIFTTLDTLRKKIDDCENI